MSSKPRNFKLGGIYHIIKRGINHEKVLKDKQDYSRLSLDLEFCNSYKDVNLWNVLAKENRSGLKGSLSERIQEARKSKGDPMTDLLGFAIMPTHIHFILQEIVNNGIIKYMQKLGGYSLYFNKRHGRDGSLFQTYKCILIESDSQLKVVFNYVHTNPISLWEPGWKNSQVKNKDVALRKLENYSWSSYPTYIGKDMFLDAINREFFLDLFGGEEQCKQAVEDWVNYKASQTNIDKDLLE